MIYENGYLEYCECVAKRILNPNGLVSHTNHYTLFCRFEPFRVQYCYLVTL